MSEPAVLRPGGSGEAVRDLQRRLLALGHEIAPSEIGTFGPTTSVAIPGDTARVRLVSDASIGKFGYHVDKVEILQADSIFASDFE